MIRAALLLFKILLLIAICSMFWPQLRWDEFADSFTRTSATTVMAVLALFMLQAAMAAMRWRLILRQLGYSLTVGATVEAWLVGQCASQFLPAVVGGWIVLPVKEAGSEQASDVLLARPNLSA
jgi:uncharacterized membrane protein YbhN (UPF0104 family)